MTGLTRFKQRAKREVKRNYRKWIIIGLAALVVRYVLLVPVFWLPEGWLIVLSAVGAAIISDILFGLYKVY